MSFDCDENLMKIGDFVKLVDSLDPDNRSVGIVLRFDTYRSHSYMDPEQLAEVLWETGKIGFVLSERLAIVRSVEPKDSL